MKIEDIELGMQVMCTKICPIELPESEHRVIGYVGNVVSINAMENLAYVAHLELTPEGYREVTNVFSIEEMEPFDPIPLMHDTPLRKAIDKTLMDVIDE